MPTYCVTFRISDQTVGGKTYAERRDALYLATKTKGMGYWEETTSFILAESNLDTGSFARKVTAPLSSKHDMLFVFDPEDMSSVAFGAVDRFDVLQSFFPDAKKLP